jgi:hypothetical protein
MIKTTTSKHITKNFLSTLGLEVYWYSQHGYATICITDASLLPLLSESQKENAHSGQQLGESVMGFGNFNHPDGYWKTVKYYTTAAFDRLKESIDDGDFD